MIHFDSSRAFGRATYYACKMFADNLSSVNLRTTVHYKDSQAKPIRGQIGLGAFATLAEFKGLKVEENGQTIAIPGYKGWHHETGTWSEIDGAYGQREKTDYEECFSYMTGNFHDYELNVKARKIRGAEGFMISLGIDGMRVQANFGGWGNGLNAIQVASGSPVAQSRGHIETGRWYDVKIQTRGRTVVAYLDGKKVLERNLPESNALLAIAGRDEATHEIIVKVVNNGSNAKEVTLNLTRAKLTGAGSETVLTSQNSTAENSFDQPRRIVPQTKPVSGATSNFPRTFPPYSITILRLKELKPQEARA